MNKQLNQNGDSIPHSDLNSWKPSSHVQSQLKLKWAKKQNPEAQSLQDIL